MNNKFSTNSNSILINKYLKILFSAVVIVSIYAPLSTANAQLICKNVFLAESLDRGNDSLGPNPPQFTALNITNPRAPLSLDNQQIYQRYGTKESEIHRTPKFNIPVVFKMSTHEDWMTQRAFTAPVKENKTYDTIIVGGGPAGLTAALYLAEAGKSVLLLERNSKVGGLAMGNELKGIRAGGGAAYSSGPEGKFEYDMFKKIGLGDYRKKLAIKEPIDSYEWNGVLYEGIWEEHTLDKLPESFRLFKHALLKLAKNKAGKEDGGIYAEWADQMDMSTLVRRMPEIVKSWNDKKSKEILKNFLNDSRVSKTDPMKDVLNLLDLYGRSALGGVASEISARQFIDFYEAEIYTRYTGSLGTGTVIEALQKKLAKYKHLIDIRTSAPVSEFNSTDSDTSVTFSENGITKVASGKMGIYSIALNQAPKLIKDLEAHDPEKVKMISEIKMTDYAVHTVRLKGHPYRATYDTWTFSMGDLSKPTDIINGRWQDLDAFEATRDFKSHPKDDYGVLTIYQPIGKSDKNNFNQENSLKRVDDAIEFMYQKIRNFANPKGQKIEIELVESYRWPESIHVVSPGYLKKIPILARPFKNIHFANNTVAAPELETAMSRAAQEAIQIIHRLNDDSIKTKPTSH